MEYSLLTMIIVLVFGVVLLSVILYQDWRTPHKQKRA